MLPRPRWTVSLAHDRCGRRVLLLLRASLGGRNDGYRPRRGAMRSRSTRAAAVTAFAIGGLAALVLTPPPAAAQFVTDRTPNVEGGWIGDPGTIQFHLLHRFWTVNDNLVSSPTLSLSTPAADRILLGGRYASNSLVVPGESNEWELFARWAPMAPESHPVGFSLTGSWNASPGSFDAEAGLGFLIGRARILGALRVFSDARDTGNTGWGSFVGAVLPINENVAIAGDYGASWIDGDRGRSVWGGALQLRIPLSPHSLSLQATNTRTGTLHGSSFPSRTTWGFEFTIPLTLSRYLFQP